MREPDFHNVVFRRTTSYLGVHFTTLFFKISIKFLRSGSLQVSASASASVSALMPASILENGYDTDAWCEWYRYKSMWAMH